MVRPSSIQEFTTLELEPARGPPELERPEEPEEPLTRFLS